MLKNTFFNLVKKYTTDESFVNKLWDKIEAAYSSDSRHYHTILHLQNMLRQLAQVKDQIQDWDTVLFALFYHDIIYRPAKNNNEEISAEHAKQDLLSIGVPAEQISKCVQLILATKKHLESNDNDTNFFTDADLSILGQGWQEYENYFRQVRREYSIYPDLIYQPGRKKVLEHFFNMERIYKSDYFYEQLETNAKRNLLREIELYK